MGQSRFSQRRNRRIQNWFWIFSNQSISRPIFSKKKSVFHKGKIGEVEVRWIFSIRSISRPIFSRTKMEKGYFPRGRVEVGWIQRSIDFACNPKFSSKRKMEKESIFQESDFARHCFPRWEPLAGTGVVSLGASIPRGVGLLHDPADRPRTSNGSVIWRGWRTNRKRFNPETSLFRPSPPPRYS